MLQYLTSEDKIGEILLTHRHPKFEDEIFIIVEGTSDVKLFGHIIDDDCITIEQSYGGKEQVINIVKELNRLSDDRVVGICDADFDRLLGEHEKYHPQGLFMTDAHDVEMMILLSDCRKKIACEFSHSKINKEVHEHYISSVCKAAHDLGVFRWMNKEEGAGEGLKLNFKGLKVSNYFTFTKYEYEFNISKFISDLISKSSGMDPIVDESFLLNKYHEYKSRSQDYSQICCGHDVSNLSCVFFNQSKITAGKKVARDAFESFLRASYEVVLFKHTKLYSLLNDELARKRKNIRKKKVSKLEE